MQNSIFTEEIEQEIRISLKRCRPEVIESAVQFRSTGDKSLVATIVLGIIERFLEPEAKSKLQEAQYGEYRLIEDLGVDSLVMVEIVMTIEEVLELSIPNDDLRSLSTINDVKDYIEKLMQTLESVPANANA